MFLANSSIVVTNHVDQRLHSWLLLVSRPFGWHPGSSRCPQKEIQSHTPLRWLAWSLHLKPRCLTPTWSFASCWQSSLFIIWDSWALCHCLWRVTVFVFAAHQANASCTGVLGGWFSSLGTNYPASPTLSLHVTHPLVVRVSVHPAGYVLLRDLWTSRYYTNVTGLSRAQQAHKSLRWHAAVLHTKSTFHGLVYLRLNVDPRCWSPRLSSPSIVWQELFHSLSCCTTIWHHLTVCFLILGVGHLFSQDFFVAFTPRSQSHQGHNPLCSLLTTILSSFNSDPRCCTGFVHYLLSVLRLIRMNLSRCLTLRLDNYRLSWYGTSLVVTVSRGRRRSLRVHCNGSWSRRLWYLVSLSLVHGY